MTDHEMILLRAAVEAGERTHGFRWWPILSDQGEHGGYYVATNDDMASAERPTLADALTALLRDLDADVPEWPSEEQVANTLRNLDPVAVAGGIDLRPSLDDLRTLPLPEYLALRGEET